jgi:hypothetical protein
MVLANSGLEPDRNLLTVGQRDYYRVPYHGNFKLSFSNREIQGILHYTKKLKGMVKYNYFSIVLH